MVARDTGFQVIHYISVGLASETPFIGQGVLLGDLPVGSVITDLDVTVINPFGGGVQLALARTPGGTPLVTFGMNAVGKQKLTNALTPLSSAVFGQGGRFYAFLTGTLAPGGAAFAVLSYAPKVG